MKILLVSLNHHPEQTGIGKYQGEMASWLAARGHEVRVITAPPYYPAWKISPGYSGWRYTREELDGATVYRVPLYVPSSPGGIKRLIHMLSFALSAFPVLLWQAMFWRPEVIFTTAPPLAVAPEVLFACWISGARSHLHVQDFEVDAAFQLGLLKPPRLFRISLGIERVILRAFAKVSTISRRMRERLITKGVPAERAFMIPNWAGVHDFDPMIGAGDWRQRLNVDPNTVLVVYSGNMGRKQGLEIIVEAARLLEERPDIRFVVCGDGAAREDMMVSARELTNMIFLPVQSSSDFVHLMIAADIHLLPQRAEAADLVMPSKLGNILASGRPVVASAAKGTQIYDAVSGCGIAVEPGNAEEFAKAISTLADDAELRAGMGIVGRNRALDEWSRDNILERMEALFERPHACRSDLPVYQEK
jgi:colanic acid biosynthesis glycosyl transferase WcaI